MVVVEPLKSPNGIWRGGCRHRVNLRPFLYATQYQIEALFWDDGAHDAEVREGDVEGL